MHRYRYLNYPGQVRVVECIRVPNAIWRVDFGALTLGPSMVLSSSSGEFEMRSSWTYVGVIALVGAAVITGVGCSNSDTGHSAASGGSTGSQGTGGDLSTGGSSATAVNSGTGDRPSIAGAWSVDHSSASSNAGGNSAAGGQTSVGAGGNTAAGGSTGDPITGLQALTWTAVPFADAHCRDGSTTGIGVNTNPASNKLMIYLEGGGACFNAPTCASNPSSFDSASFLASLGSYQQTGGPGIFNRTDSNNPVKDWNFVYVPYCTGDVHAGNNPNGSVDSVGPQQFVGYANIGLFLKRIVPTFGDATQVLLTGASAGGFGATANYIQVAKAFGSTPVYLLDDSGPFMDTAYLPQCLAQTFIQTWSLDKTVLQDCGSDCADTSHTFIDYVKHLARSYPTVPMGLIDSTGDNVITQFFGFGALDCSIYTQVSAATFTAGLQDIRTQLTSYSNFGVYIFPSTDHTTLESSTYFDTRTAANVTLASWIAQLVGGRVTNVGP